MNLKHIINHTGILDTQKQGTDNAIQINSLKNTHRYTKVSKVSTLFREGDPFGLISLSWGPLLKHLHEQELSEDNGALYGSLPLKWAI